MAANPNVIPTCGVPVGFAVAAAVAGVAVAVAAGAGAGAAEWVTEAVGGATIFLVDRPRAGMATHQKREEGGFSRENLSGENLPKKSSDLKFAREGPHPSAVTLRTISSALARA